jgi:hypothetical protein
MYLPHPLAECEDIHGRWAMMGEEEGEGGGVAFLNPRMGRCKLKPKI